MSAGNSDQTVIERDLRWRFLKLEDKLDRVNLTLDLILEELANQRKEMAAVALDARKEEPGSP